MRLVPILAIMALFLGLVSVAHAQSTAPTVSSVAITSSPGADNTYAKGDTNTVTLTFSEAVTVDTTNGTPYVTIDIGGQPRNVRSSGDGTSAAAQPFSYTVLLGDRDTDGISVLENSLTLDGGAIQATDDSAGSTLTHAAMTFANHKVDTHRTLLSNIGQTDAAETITVSATQSATASFTTVFGASDYNLKEIVLDVKNASDTLDVTITVSQEEIRLANYVFSGSVAATGRQVFTLDDPYQQLASIITDDNYTYEIAISGTGSGTVEIGATSSSSQDSGSLSSWGIVDPSSITAIPRFGLHGYEGVHPFIYHAEITSNPEDGTTYREGERIEVFVVFHRGLQGTIPAEAEIWLGTGAQHPRAAGLVTDFTDFPNYFAVYAYTVQTGDRDTDGILLGENPLGLNANADLTINYDSSAPAVLTYGAVQMGVDQLVDGSQARTCAEIICAEIHPGRYSATSDLVGFFTAWEYDFRQGASSDDYPYPPWDERGESSQITFEYGPEEHAIVELALIHPITFALYCPVLLSECLSLRDPHLAVIMDPAISASAAERLGFIVDGSVFHFTEAGTGSGDITFWWTNPGVTFADGEPVSVKLIENATATFDAASHTRNEGDTLDVTVTLSDPFTENTIKLPIVVTGNGADAGDYSGIPQDLVFAPGDTEKTFTVTIEDDDIDDDDESITISFGDESHIKSGGAHEEVIITLTDNDDPEVKVSFGTDTYTAAEDGTATVTVTLSADPERTVVIPLVKTNQGDAEDDDYSGVPSTVTFNATETVQSFTFMATDDSIDDDGESVLLAFGAMPDARVSPGDTVEATVSITDDDDPFVRVQFSQDSYTAPEGGSVSVSVTLSADPERQVVIPLLKTHQGETTTGDYSGVPSSVTFNATETVQSFTFTAIQDGVDDDDDSVRLSFGPMPDPRVSPGTTDETTVNITDDDDPIVTVIFGRASYRVLEGDKVTVGVTLSADPERTVIIPITATAQNDTTAADYSVTQSSVTFNEGETSKTIEFTAAADTEEDDGDSVLLGFGSMPDARVSAGTPSQTTVSIFADCGDVDIWCASLSFNLTDFGSERLNVNQIDTLDFHYGGVDYQLITIRVIQNGHHSGDDVNVKLPFGVPERTKWSMDFRNLNSGRGIEQFEILTEDWRDWTLHVSTVSGGDTLTAALRFSEAWYTGQAWWWFFGRDIDHLRRVWEPDQLYKLRLVEDPRSERPPQPLNPPTYLRARGVVNTNQVALSWLAPQMRDDQVPPVDSYKVQWKQSSGSWDTPADVSETTTGPSNGVESHFLDGLTPGTEYNIRVMATDSVGDSEPSNEITYTMPADAQFSVSNTPAEGAPRIDGTPEAEQTLTADTTGITDADGLNEVVFQYRWLADNAEVDGATGSTYTLTSGDEGRAITVRVDFTDDAGNEESLTSAPTVVTAAGLELRSATVDGAALTLTYNEDLDNSFRPPDSAFAVNVNGESRTPTGVAVGQTNLVLLLSQAVEAGDTVTVDYTAPDGANSIQDILGQKADSFSGQAVTNNTAPADAGKSDPAQTPGSPVSLQVVRHGSGQLTASWAAPDSGLDPTGYTLQWKESGADWAAQEAVSEANAKGISHIITGLTDGVEYAVRVIAYKDDAESAPSGEVAATPQETVPPSLSSAVVDGAALTVTFDEALDTNGGPDKTAFAVTVDYTAPTDQSAAWLQDLAGNAAASFSGQDLSNNTQAADRLTASASGVPTSHDDHVTFELEFSEEFPLSYKTLRDHAFTVTGGDVTNARRLDPLSNEGWEIHVEPDGDGAVTIELPVTTDCTAESAICTQDRRPLSSLLEMTVPGPGDAQQTPPNSRATGAPTITGTTQVGETLTAGTLDIADDDGLANVSFSYQWLADDSDISGATNATYTLEEAEEGKGIKVRVSFTDDAGNEETLTSEVTAAAPPPNTPAAGAPTITGAAQVGETLTASTTRISDADGLDDVTFAYQWLAGDAEINGATANTYTLAGDDEGKAVKVRVSFNDDAGNPEALTSAATGAVATPPNTPATGAPTISGTTQVGETLTAGTNNISDGDGLENAAFAYQWLADDAEINGATASAYTLAGDDEGKAVKVRVSFNDDAGNPEALTSQATAAVAEAAPTGPPPAPQNLTAVVNGDGHIVLSWEAPGDDSITGYQILRRRPTEGEDTLLVYVADTQSAATTYTDTNVTQGVQHAYRVKAINAVGLSRQSNFVNVTP